MKVARIGRRRAVWEGGYELSEIARSEFNGYPALSVYEVSTDEHGQMHAEHGASTLNRPRAPFFALLLDGFGAPRPEPGDTGFYFTRQRHRLVEFADDEELNRCIRAVQADTSRTEETQPERIARHVVSAIESGSSEWLLCKNLKGWTKWAKNSLSGPKQG